MQQNLKAQLDGCLLHQDKMYVAITKIKPYHCGIEIVAEFLMLNKDKY